MTTQRDLVELAQKHRENPGVSALLLSLTESMMQAQMALNHVESNCGTLRRATSMDEGFRVPLDSSEFVAQAAKAAAALSRMSAAYSSLACVLQALGEDIDY